MISLVFFKPEEHLSGVSYSLDENQLRFTASANQALQSIEAREDDDAFPITILVNNIPAGFFVLDFGNDKFELTENENSVLVRSLSVNPELQGKGIGKAAMLQVDDFVRKNFKDCDEIVLAVNQKNDSAYHIYLKAGYIYDGKTRIGRSGPQYLMYKKI
ncbi:MULTISPECIES: GNAT family N-acetyltransferase [unclassified Chryseobacterium]|uniref:GNAT family N-acetyltransferase n=1 Tax=unclassified Chryseobacterium TaxID=2593645 RepID=UPI00100BA217|nr:MULTISPECIES: GNAT family N-acetyltransferase [unclassified Chryseobacterium]RXM49758.1 GNAT family N-acetyltransferase [Chryseobacterium sp. CH25]RXM62990.1 GNAT family N-acetyltransferase [Chryseobacterium sp. CH1]